MGTFINHPPPPSPGCLLFVLHLTSIPFFASRQTRKKKKITGNIILFRSPGIYIGSSTRHGLSIYTTYLIQIINIIKKIFRSCFPSAQLHCNLLLLIIIIIFFDCLLLYLLLLYRPIHAHNVYILGCFIPALFFCFTSGFADWGSK
jgi:hypothetical protein